MAFTLQPLLKEDAPRCVVVYFAAFQNSHARGCWPHTLTIRKWFERMITDELDESGSHWLKAVSSRTGEIAGLAKWQQPKPGVFPSLALPRWPDGADHALCDETYGAWARMQRELMGDRGHWYLELLATDPAYQGKGAGSMMMRWGLERAIEQQVEAYLEASPEGVPLYETFGFRVAGKTDTFIDNERVRKTWYRSLSMLRKPTPTLAGCS